MLGRAVTLENASFTPEEEPDKPGAGRSSAQAGLLPPCAQAWLNVSSPSSALSVFLGNLAAQEGTEVSLVTAPSAQEALEAWATRDDFRLAFVDLSNLEVGQLEGLPRGTEAGAALAVVALGPEELALQALEAGVHEYVTPLELSLQALRRAKERALRRKSWEAHRLERLLHDELTGLPLRTLFMDRLHMAIRTSVRDATPCALFFLDVDDFKQANDTLGHQAGDAVLKEVGRRLRNVVRAGDSVARLGGDEFAVLMPGVVSKEAANHLAQALVNAMAPPVLAPHGQFLPVSLSVGGLWMATATLPAAEMLHHADMAMYQAKFSGKGQICLL